MVFQLTIIIYMESHLNARLSTKKKKKIMTLPQKVYFNNLV